MNSVNLQCLIKIFHQFAFDAVIDCLQTVRYSVDCRSVTMVVTEMAVDRYVRRISPDLDCFYLVAFDPFLENGNEIVIALCVV